MSGLRQIRGMWGLILLFLTAPAWAADGIDTVAGNFLRFLNADKRVESIQPVESNRLDPSLPSIVVGHLARLSGGGYILIADSTRLTPIKAYSLYRTFEALPEAYRTYLMKEMEYNARGLEAQAASKTVASLSSAPNQERWDFLLNFEYLRTPLSYMADTYLLKSMWNQDSPYNKFLPAIGDQIVLTGCVNTAMAQVMRYHQHPPSGSGVVSYTWQGQVLKAVLYRPYNWENMPDIVDAFTPEHMADEVASLMRDLGISNQTAFNLTGSSTNVTGSLVDNFGYSNLMTSMINSDTSLFFNTIKNEIDAERPVLLSFPGHMTVVDGYGSDATGRKVHVNMGWGGYDNDFYFLDDPYIQGFPTAPGALEIYHHIMPCSGSDCAAGAESHDSITSLNVTGRFDYETDADRYSIYLKGITSITASRGYGNLAFIISLTNDSNGNVVYSTTGNEDAGLLTDALDVPLGRYTLTASLCDDSSCWGYDPAHPGYTVSLNTQAVSDGEKQSIDSSIDKAPVIYTDLRNMLLKASGSEPRKILIDARDENGDTMALNAENTNAGSLSAVLTKNVLTLTPVPGAKSSSRITVTASANGRTTEKSFVVLMSDEDVSFGKTFVVKGLFENEGDFNKHKVILDGTCTITGDRGYSNQAFFSSVMDGSSNYVILPTAPPPAGYLTGSFPRNTYLLGASFCSSPPHSGTCYAYEQDGAYNRYTLTVDCPQADESITTVAQVLGIDLGGSEPNTRTLHLKTGWNFISFPVAPLGQVATVLQAISAHVRIVWGYDNLGKRWLKYPAQDGLAAFETGKGYWILMDQDAQLTITGQPAAPQPVRLQEGWNLAGYNGEDGKDIVVALSAPAISGKWSFIWGWAEGIWAAKHETAALPVSVLGALYNDRAYWIHIKKGQGGFDWTQ
jgi:hypothetical protein